MTSKQRAFLRKEANGLEPVYHIGKNGIGGAVIDGIGEALKARELVKISVQESCEYTAKEAAGAAAAALGAESVQVVGRRFVLYRRNPDINGYGV